MIFQGRPISKGKARGYAIVLRSAFSFLGGVNPQSGIFTVSSGKEGESLDGKVFIFQRGKGSTVGSYTLLDLKKNGHLPAAIINERAETIVATGAVMAGVPMVDGIDITLVQDGDLVEVDGDKGTVDILDVTISEVVTCVLRNDGKFLVLKRSDKVSTNRQKWAGVSGFVEKGEEPLETAYKEIAEETGVEEPQLVRIGKLVTIRSEGRIWRIHPFLFDIDSPNITLDWEHTECRWMAKGEMEDLDLVPGFIKLLSDLDP